MTNIEKIESSIPLQMSLSELLHEALEVNSCWHEWEWMEVIGKDGLRTNAQCSTCKETCLVIHTALYGLPTNPNYFTRESFLDVWDAVKDREDFFEKFLVCGNPDAYSGITYDIPTFHIASPHFQYEVLRWLDPEGLEKVMKEVGE